MYTVSSTLLEIEDVEEEKEEEGVEEQEEEKM